MLSFSEPAITIQEADDYAESRAYSDWLEASSSPATAKEAAIRRGQDYIAGRYNGRWLSEFENDDAPDQVKYAIAEAARLELATPGVLAPVLSRAGQVKRKRVKAAVVETETEYFDGAPSQDTIVKIDLLLQGLIAGGAVVDLVRV